jgi:hypothetical protein
MAICQIAKPHNSTIWTIAAFLAGALAGTTGVIALAAWGERNQGGRW